MRWFYIFIGILIVISAPIKAENQQENFLKKWDHLELYFEGDSRILKKLDDSNYLLCRLKPTIFSLKHQGPIDLPGIDHVRTKINALLCDYLHSHGIKTSTVATYGDFIVMKKEKVAPLEIIVKGAFVGSPKHIYPNIAKTSTKKDKFLIAGQRYQPYVRFDWRVAPPGEDLCMPKGLADHFIDTNTAEKTALKAFILLRDFFNQHELELQDICFFMNEKGDTICAEVSTDNIRVTYRGKDPKLQKLFASRSKENALERAETVFKLLASPAKPRTRILISGPFCTGKTTLIKFIETELGIPKLIDHSTREMRPGERQGFPYHFVSKEEFQKHLAKGDYYEWVNFNGQFYGVPKKELFEKEKWVLDVLSTSLHNYQGKVPGIVSIYLQPPSVEELVRRARLRGDCEEKIKERIANLVDEDCSGYDYVIPAETTVEEKLQLVRKIVLGEEVSGCIGQR